MKDRIRQLMLDKGMSQKTFANELCIAEATLSGIFNGRTRPTHLTINAIHECFPEVNISWLMFGEGEMYSALAPANVSESDAPAASEASDEPVDLFSFSSSASSYTDHAHGMPESAIVPEQQFGSASPSKTVQGLQMQAPQIQYIEKYIDKPRRKITEIRIFFDDGTYETFTP